MAQSCDGYSKVSLMGNYYEQRLAPVQPFRDENQQYNRVKEDSISFPGPDGALIPLPTVKRNQPWNTNGVTANDGFNEKRTIFSTHYDPQALENYQNLKDQRAISKVYGNIIIKPEVNTTSVQLSGSKDYKMLTPENLKQITDVERQSNVNVSDFGSTFQKHPESEEQFYGVSTYHVAFSKPVRETLDEIVDKYEKSKTIINGYNERPSEKQGTMMTSVLTAEKYKDEYQPKDNTSVQRSWLPYSDKGVVNAQKNLVDNQTSISQQSLSVKNPLQTYRLNMSQMPVYDNANSLPLENGESKFNLRYNNPGQFRHVRTDVTTIRNNVITKK